jgi:hypothetical protein
MIWPRWSIGHALLATANETNDLAADIACVQESLDRCVSSEGLSYSRGAAASDPVTVIGRVCAGLLP